MNYSYQFLFICSHFHIHTFIIFIIIFSFFFSFFFFSSSSSSSQQQHQQQHHHHHHHPTTQSCEPRHPLYVDGVCSVLLCGHPALSRGWVGDVLHALAAMKHRMAEMRESRIKFKIEDTEAKWNGEHGVVDTEGQQEKEKGDSRKEISEQMKAAVETMYHFFILCLCSHFILFLFYFSLLYKFDKHIFSPFLLSCVAHTRLHIQRRASQPQKCSHRCRRHLRGVHR